jgi:chorismate synthase
MTTPLETIDLMTHETVDASKERSDVCAVPAAAVVAEAQCALILADAYAEKFGCDTLADALQAFESYVARIAVR